MDRLSSAIVAGRDAEVAEILARAPECGRAARQDEVFIEPIRHWLYAGDTPLHLAAAALNARALALLLEAGAPVNAENRRGATALHYACDPRPRSAGAWDPESQGRIIAALVAGGADPDRADRGGATPLHRAVRARSPVAGKQLLRAGARVDPRLGKRGSTPIHLAAQSTGAGGTAHTEREQQEIIELLLRHGADPLLPDANGKTAVDWASRASLRAALTETRGPGATLE
jgi:ankyrin repeat protein